MKDKQAASGAHTAAHGRRADPSPLARRHYPRARRAPARRELLAAVAVTMADGRRSSMKVRITTGKHPK